MFLADFKLKSTSIKVVLNSQTYKCHNQSTSAISISAEKLIKVGISNRSFKIYIMCYPLSFVEKI